MASAPERPKGKSLSDLNMVWSFARHYPGHIACAAIALLFAAGATFTLLAWAFAYAFYVCQAWYPGSFTSMSPGESRSWIELLFLSFTVLSGVGLGDVLPVSDPARVLVMLEEFAGVGYIAAIVSRLIGLTIRDRR